MCIRDREHLPPVSLEEAPRSGELFQRLLRIFLDNPSPLNASPRDARQLRSAMEKGTRYWLARDAHGEIVGALGLETWRSMVVHVTVDAARRARGLGLSMVLALHEEARSAGFTELRAQVLRRNPRALSLFLSLGYLPLEGMVRRYHELVKCLDEGGPRSGRDPAPDGPVAAGPPPGDDPGRSAGS